MLPIDAATSQHQGREADTGALHAAIRAERTDYQAQIAPFRETVAALVEDHPAVMQQLVTVIYHVGAGRFEDDDWTYQGFLATFPELALLVTAVRAEDAAHERLYAHRAAQNKEQALSFKLTKQLAAQLGEVAPMPITQIRRIIELAGMDTAQALADEAVTIAAGAGMLTPDGTPRTVGGIFFHLARQRLDPEIVQEVWMSWARRKQLQRERAGLPPRDPQAPPTPRAAPAAAPGPALPAFRWEDKAAIYRDLATEKGSVQTVKITLIGRPGRVVEKQDLVITMMTQMDAPKSFPKGVPAPPATPTVYTVYIGAKQWKNVAQAIQNSEDRLIVEGFAAFDPGLEGMAIFATNTTTRLLQQQKRQPA